MGIRDRSESRDDYVVRVLAVHTTEGLYLAEDLRDADWWEGSSHAIADDSGTLLTPAEGCVPYDRASWTLRSGNPWSENLELCALARWTRAEWLARPDLLDRCAYWLADRSKARGIPLEKLTPAQYRAGGWGVIGHHDHTVGYSDGTHWDPGPGFPWDVVLDNARAYATGLTPGGFLMALNDDQQAEVFNTVINGRTVDDRWQARMEKLARDTYNAAAQGRTIASQARAIAAAAAAGADIDEKALAAALAPSVIAALGEAKGITQEDIEAAVRRVFDDAATS